MKFTYSNYPFVGFIQKSMFLEIDGLIKAINALGIIDLPDYEIQYFCKTFIEDAENSLKTLLQLFPLLKPCQGCELMRDGQALYYSINPAKKDGLKFILVKYFQNEELLKFIGDQLPGKADTTIDKMKDFIRMLSARSSRVISYGKSVDFVYEIKNDRPSFLIEYEITDCIKSGLFDSQNGSNMLTILFYNLWIKNLYLQNVDVKTHYIGESGKKKIKIEGQKFYSDFPIKVFIYDRSYYNQIISKYPISVVGHMRNQRFGKGNQQTKLIYINPYEKKGRITRAKKNLRNKN